MSWENIELGCAISIKHGYAFKSKHFADSGDFLLLTPGNFHEEGGFRSRPGKDRFFIGDIPENYILEEDDLIIAMTEQGAGLLGSSALIPAGNKYLHNQRLGLLYNIDNSILDKRYLYYLFNTRDVRHQINASSTGVKVKHTAPERVYKVKVELPQVSIQQKISTILSAYDNLIENNLRRIKLLEESARLLYREWFINLRFPGHQHARIVDGVPEGWEEKVIADIAESVRYGYTASAADEEIGPKFLRITDIVPPIIDWQRVPFCKIKENQIEKFILREGDIVVARTGATTGYAKRLHKLHPKTVFASYLVRIRLKKEVDDVFIGVFVESEEYKKYINAHIGGAAQPNANAKIISGAKLLIPTDSLQGLFREHVEPYFDKKEILQIQNQKLKSARDLLLPRLMNGELAV